ncbi:hypothetical protein [Clostridium butyricum]|uniref:hypothetical protein n=1 Tax=Clostridium butyricum TaxID=1492 RepID=UPI002AB314B4|nr:hypothetical protein [Clostridium butyricum]
MGNLLVEDKNIKSSISNFAIYQNEEIKYEGKEISQSLFAYKIQSGFFQAIDIEIINAIYLLKYSTSRQITTFLNYVKNINVDQSFISKRLTKLNNSSAIGRYAFFSDEREKETGLKCYVLRERGKRLLLQREYPCKWDIFNSSLILEDIKNYLARNNYILKLISTRIIDYEKIALDNDTSIIKGSYRIDSHKHLILAIRKNNPGSYLEKFLAGLDSYSSFLKIIIIGETDLHLFELYKQILILIQNKKIDVKILNLIFFTQDLRIIERDIDSCFIVYKRNGTKVILEDCKLQELSIKTIQVGSD